MSDIILEDFFDNVNIETSTEDEVKLEDTTKYINLIYHKKWYNQLKDDPEVIEKLVNKIKNKVQYWFDNVFEKVSEPQITFYYEEYESSEYTDKDDIICSISFEIAIDAKTTKRMLNHLIHVVFDTVFSDDYKIYCFNLSDKKSVDCEPGDIITLDKYSYDQIGHSKFTSDIIQSFCDELCYSSLNEDFFDDIEVETIEDDKVEVEIENKDYVLDMFFAWILAPMHMANLEDTFIRANRLKRQIEGINEMIFDKCSDISMFIPDHLNWSPNDKLGEPFSETTLTKNTKMILYKFSVPAHCLKYNKLQKYIDKIYNAIDKCSYRMVHNILSVRLYLYYKDFGYFGLDTLILSEDYLDYQFNPLLRYQSTKIFADVLCDKESILDAINKLKLDTVIYGNCLSSFHFSTKDLELSKLKKPFDFYKDNIAIKIFPMAQVKKFSTTIKYDPAADNIDNLNPNFLDDQSILTDIINIVNNYNGDVVSIEDNDNYIIILRDVLYEITINDMLRHYHIGVVVNDRDLADYI